MTSPFAGDAVGSVSTGSWRGWMGRRPIRLRWPTCVVLVLVTASLIVIIVPGAPDELSVAEVAHYDALWRATPSLQLVAPQIGWAHGWPLTYLRRIPPFDYRVEAISLPSGYPISWMSSRAWTVEGDRRMLNPLNLLIDGFLFLFLIVGITAGCEYWCRRRGKLRFSLFDLIAITTLVGLVLGWWQYHSLRRDAERRAIELLERDAPLNTNGTKSGLKHRLEYRGPIWLGRLLGNPAILPFCWHIQDMDLNVGGLTAEDLPVARDLPYLEQLRFGGPWTDASIDFLASLPNLRRISPPSTFSNGRWPQPLAPPELQRLARLPRLEILEFGNRNFLIEDLAPLAIFPSLQAVYLNCITATGDELQGFREVHPQLEIYWDNACEVDARHVAASRIARWGGAMYVSNDLTSVGDDLDLSNTLLTRERLQVLLPGLAEIRAIGLGRLDSPETAAELFKRCATIEALDAPHVDLPIDVLKSLNGASELRLSVRQGDLTVEDFCELVQRLRPYCLQIYGWTFSEEEGDKIYDASPETHIQGFLGLDESEEVYPIISEDSPFAPLPPIGNDLNSAAAQPAATDED